ncbi:MAG: helicase [Phycisphaerae bacterium]|jgi:hypothetical protein|nr:MAG: helicase [Phycisphaerae bacterium]
MLFAIWDTTRLHIFATVSRDDLQPVEPAQIRILLGDLSDDALLPTAAEESTLAVNVPGLGVLNVGALRFDPAEAIDLLTSLPISLPSSCSDSVRVWQVLARLVQNALAHQQFYPSLRYQDGTYTAVWQPLIGGRSEVEKLQRFALAIPAVCRALPGLQETPPMRLVESFLTETTDALIRRAVVTDSFFSRVHERPAPIDVRWLSALLGQNRQVQADPAELVKLYDDVHLWLGPITDTSEWTNFRLGFRLREPQDGSDLWPVDFRLVSEETDPLTMVTATELWRQKPSPLTSLGRTIAERQEQFLSELRRAMEYFPSLERALLAERPTGIELSAPEAFAFMRSWAFALEDAGFHVDLPDWASPQDSELSLRLSIAPLNAPDDADDDGWETGFSSNPGTGHLLSTPGNVGLDALVRFDWRIAIGDQHLTLVEFESLVSQQSPLVKFKDRWVQIDLEAARKAQEMMTRSSRGLMTLGDAFRVAYGLSGEEGVPVGGLTGADWIGHLIDQIPDARLQEIPQPDSFAGELRPYQLRGLQWLAYLDRLGLGACLADDMGLGKTIQFISLLLMERHGNVPERVQPGPTLVFAPASVLGNWMRELQRFAPSLKVMSHHGPARLHGHAFAEAARAHDVVLTGYALAHRDIEDFRQLVWHRLALDEAQKVKNPSAAASVAIRSIPARRRVALTGTPIENHLSELWSIMETLNPGLLGSPTQFRQRFVIPVEKMNDHRRGQLLREMIKPFVLRRTKSDPEVAANLPQKMEMRVFTSLTPEQAAMYERITAEMLNSVENASGIRRRGLILAGLTRLKQVCDHPALLTDNKNTDSRSGKAERLIDMLEEVLEENEAALVFTQYREMGHLLQEMIRRRLNHDPLFLHGGIQVKERDAMINEFQKDGSQHRIFILSLRAGGLGLNLTAANHVFHYDRWWNPAVEAQATDRAHRIGQDKIVQVHKFVSIGTVEERIDKLLADKTALAENIVTSGDQWLTNLSTDDLKRYLALSSEAVEESTYES